MQWPARSSTSSCTRATCQRQRRFYAGLFGWDLQDTPMPGGGGTYTMINVGEGTGGGMTATEGTDAGSYWMSYVGVDDVRAKTAQAKALGGNGVAGRARRRRLRLDECHPRSRGCDDRDVAGARRQVTKRAPVRPMLHAAPRRRRMRIARVCPVGSRCWRRSACSSPPRRVQTSTNARERRGR